MQQPTPSDRPKPVGYVVKIWWPAVKNRIDVFYSTREEAERRAKDFVESRGATFAIVEEIIG